MRMAIDQTALGGAPAVMLAGTDSDNPGRPPAWWTIQAVPLSDGLPTFYHIKGIVAL